MNPEEKWIHELETMDVVALGYLYPGLPDDYYTDEEYPSEAFADAIEEFCRKHRYSERTHNSLLDSIPARDAFYKMLEREGVMREKQNEKLNTLLESV